MNIKRIYCIGHEWLEIKSNPRFATTLEHIRAAQSARSVVRYLNEEYASVGSNSSVQSPSFYYYRNSIRVYRRDIHVNLLEWLDDVKQSPQLGQLESPDIICLILFDENNVNRTGFNRQNRFYGNLAFLETLGFTFPFVAIELTTETQLSLETEVVNFKIKQFSQSDYKDVIDKSIEFPPEYYTAGLGIINFFGTYLREQYPGENAKVKIEQDGLIVRMIVSTSDGTSEVIEKALHEYQLIFTGKQLPESIIDNNKLLIELKYELRNAANRIETQKDIIAYQQADIKELRDLLKIALSSTSTINVNANPRATATNVVSVTLNISQILESLANLKSELSSNTQDYKELQEVEKAVDAIKNETDPNVVKHSSAMQKLGDFIKKFGEGTDKVDKAITVGKKAWETFKQLAGTYNNIAQWCGLPQVPTIFTK